MFLFFYIINSYIDIIVRRAYNNMYHIRSQQTNLVKLQNRNLNILIKMTWKYEKTRKQVCSSVKEEVRFESQRGLFGGVRSQQSE